MPIKKKLEPIFQALKVLLVFLINKIYDHIFEIILLPVIIIIALFIFILKLIIISQVEKELKASIK
ncbi:hypothetical protein Marpi_2129 (plasmid) [Marinitoga piezophila KA3]|uniref:Uncharacterized protein n=1 Tax=Marinitoga piezophila (strain DSM 14283 / JCM 11233 / KA3) TaxID=443254 RepID=H2J8F8_MARPK|nr:hypothetical protein Marpi_2129 [Marinitoga piezophila KA3]